MSPSSSVSHWQQAYSLAKRQAIRALLETLRQALVAGRSAA